MKKKKKKNCSKASHHIESKYSGTFNKIEEEAD